MAVLSRGEGIPQHQAAMLNPGAWAMLLKALGVVAILLFVV
jgi:hypothetical protein